MTTTSTSLSKRQQNFVLVAAILASSMAFIDSTALNVALPALQRSLGLSAAQLLWVVNAYTLFLASLMLIGGSLGDLYGKRRVFLIGITVFTLFSAACGLAQSGTQLIIFRGLQGIGGALMVPGSLSIISASFPQDTRGKAIGTWSMFSAFTTVFGPVLGGYLAEAGWWRAIFYINVPLGIVSFLILLLKVEEPVRPKDKKLDWQGGLWATLSFAALTFGFIQASERGFQTWWIWSSLVAGVAFLAAFIWREATASKPMMPLSLFRSPTFAGANAMTLFVYGALSSILFFVPLNLIQVQGYAEGLAGLAVLPFGGTIALLSRLSGKWTDKVGARPPLIIGPLVTGCAFLGFSFIGLTAGAGDFWTSFFPVLLLGGIGMGITVVPLTTAVMNCVNESDSGIASGVNNTMSRLAGVLAIAILGSIAILQFQKDIHQKALHSSLSDEQVQHLDREAEKLAEASPAADWPAGMQEQAQSWIDHSFIDVFNLLAYITAALCFIGAIVSWIFIKGRPKKVQLD